MGKIAVTQLCTILGQAVDTQTGLTTAGAIVMTSSILLVLGLSVFCTIRILREPAPSEHHHAPLDIDTHDRDA